MDGPQGRDYSIERWTLSACRAVALRRRVGRWTLLLLYDRTEDSDRRFHLAAWN